MTPDEWTAAKVELRRGAITIVTGSNPKTLCHFEPVVGRGTIKWPSVSKALQKAGLPVGDRPVNIELTRDAATALLRLSKTWSLPKF